MTETASLISLNHPFRAAEGSIGKVLPGREFRLAEDGEILVRGENVSSGYWEAGALRPAESGSWLHTGDVGELDSEGNLRFRGRKKNVIVTPAGLNIYPEDLEGALRKQPGNSRLRGLCRMSVDGNAEPCAVLFSGMDPMKNAMSIAGRRDRRRERVAGGVPANSHLGCVAGSGFSSQLRRESRDWRVISAGAQLKFSNVGPPIRQERRCRRRSAKRWMNCCSVLRTNPLQNSSGAANLQSRLGALRSLDRVELMSALEDKFQVELDETAFSNARTADDIQALLKQPGRAANAI